MGSQLTGPWRKVQELFEKLPVVMQHNLELATKRSGKHIKKAMIEGIVNQRPEWPPLKEATIKRKGSSKALIEHGDLMHSIDDHKMLATVIFIGIHRTAKNKDGERLVSIAAVHEYGVPGRIPARPFVLPALEESTDDCHKEYRGAMKAGLKGKRYVGRHTL